MKRLIVVLCVAVFAGFGLSSCDKTKCLQCHVEDSSGQVVQTLPEFCSDNDDDRDAKEDEYKAANSTGGNDVECQEVDED